MKIITSLICLLLASNITMADDKVLYGDDNRYDVAKYADANVRELSKSVAGRVSNYRLFGVSDFFTEFYKQTLDESMYLCNGERFADQYVLPDCTGFLVGKDILVTAGHCMRSAHDCSTNSWTFGFVDGVEKLGSDELYSCKKIIDDKLVTGLFGYTKDYAVIQLDREVKGAKPLKFRTKGKIKKKAKVFVIGHPSGLPKKVADEGEVKHTWGLTFKTNLDTYAGNSGSPVFNQKTNEVEGILVQGARDYVRDGYCYKSNHEVGMKEKVFKINKVRTLVKMKKDGKL